MVLAGEWSEFANAVADRYTVTSELGRGGMAVVLLARDTRHDRKLALKLFRPAVSAALAGERFEREIQVAARLNHPHIVPLFDSGAVRQSGLPYVLLRPTAFMETWAGMLADGIRKNGVAVLFGNGRSIANFIAVKDVAEFSVRILAREKVRNAPAAGALVGRAPAPAVQQNRVPPHADGVLDRDCGARFTDWTIPADRFGVSPRSIETFVEGVPPR